MQILARIHHWWQSGYQRKLQSTILLTLLVFLGLLGSLSIYYAQQSVRRVVDEKDSTLARIVAKDISAQYDSLLHNAARLRFSLAMPGISRATQADTMVEFRKSAPLDYRALYLFDTQGRLIIHLADTLEALLAIQDVGTILERPPIPLGESIRLAYEQASQSTPYVSNVRIVGADRIPVIYMSFPIEAGEAQPSLVLVVEIDLRGVWQRVDEVSLGRTGKAMVLSREGYIIAHPDRSYIGLQADPALLPVLAGFEGKTEYVDPYNQESKLVSYSPIGRQSGWGLIIEQNRGEALAEVRRIAVLTLVVILIATPVAILIAYLLARQVTQPILNLSQVAQEITATGNLDQRIPVIGQDEVAKLAQTFNQMTASLRQYSVHMEEMVDARTRELEDAQERLVHQERLAVLGELAGGVGHELRNPLGVISNAVFYLNMVLPDASEDIKEYLDLIHTNTKEATRIVADLLDFARFKSGQRVPTNVSQMVAAALSQYPVPHSIHIEVKADDSLPPVLVDPNQIGQVLNNLLTNAYQSMPAGGKVEVSASRQSDWVEVSIADNGTGIKSEDIHKIFEPLFTTKARGIGLGLAISKNLMEANEGSIAVESTWGVGSIFRLRLPIER